MSDQEKAIEPLSPAVGSVVLPADLGYYWMHNLTSDGAEHVWRVVRIVHRGRDGRMVRDGAQIYSAKHLVKWNSVSFHGPLRPPNPELRNGSEKGTHEH